MAEVATDQAATDVRFGAPMPPETLFDLTFTSREVTAWGGLALLKRMLDGMGFNEAVQSWDLHPPGSNQGYRPEQVPRTSQA